MSSDVAIRVENLGKRYRIGAAQAPYKTIRESISGIATAPLRWLRNTRHSALSTQHSDTIWALKEVSFEVKRGEVVGIIGRNGAGKSTLLKILSRITEPTEGQAEIHGRVGSLLEVGTGFHPELTGRENIYLNGAILGMRKVEIDRKFDEIVAFAEVEKFIDTPVKHYSSGMYVRLAFGVAAHLDPEILLVDEVLAVGDLSFQEKCLGKMGQVSRQGRTILFVSHNLSAIWSLCPKCLWIDQGKLRLFGSTSDVVGAYRNEMQSRDQAIVGETGNRKGSGKVRITKIHLEDEKGHSCMSALSGGTTTFVLEYTSQDGVSLGDMEINLMVANDRDTRLFAMTNKVTGDQFTDPPRMGKLKCHVPCLPLVPGQYDLHFSCLLRGELADKILNVCKIGVAEGDFFGTNRLPNRTLGDVLVKHQWRVEGI